MKSPLSLFVADMPLRGRVEPLVRATAHCAPAKTMCVFVQRESARERERERERERARARDAHAQTHTHTHKFIHHTRTLTRAHNTDTQNNQTHTYTHTRARTHTRIWGVEGRRARQSIAIDHNGFIIVTRYAPLIQRV